MRKPFPWISALIYGLGAALGVAAFLYPFFGPIEQSAGLAQGPGRNAPLILAALISVCFVALLYEVQSHAVSAKLVALLGVLVAINSLFRFAEIAFPGPAGLSLIFFLIIIAGYVFGPRFGFLMGALTLIVSALITGGIGPWLPFQMFTSAWIGMSAPLCRLPVRWLHARHRWMETAILALFAGLWGLAYGAIINVYFWPYVAGPAAMYWQPGIGLRETLGRYLAFYVTTSLVWDMARLGGNIAITLLFGGATLRILRRFERRFTFEYDPNPSAGSI